MVWAGRFLAYASSRARRSRDSARTCRSRGIPVAAQACALRKGDQMPVTIKAAIYANSDDAFVAWAPSEFIPGCRGFLLERARKVGTNVKVEPVENRVGF